MNLLLSAIIAILPSPLKCRALRLLGNEIGGSVYIGFSLLQVRHIVLRGNAYIGHGNIFRNLQYLELGNESRINRWNYFTSGGYEHGSLVMGARSSISMRHYFDVCAEVEIGNDTIVAGIRSTFYTHSKGIDVVDYVKPITIADWCYIGSNVCFLPGATVGSHCFVGMGAVLVGNHSDDEFVLLAGNPARIKKNLDRDCAYYSQGKIVHPHMK